MKARIAFFGILLVAAAILAGCGVAMSQPGHAEPVAAAGATVAPGSPLRILQGDQLDTTDPLYSPRRILLGDWWQ